MRITRFSVRALVLSLLILGLSSLSSAAESPNEQAGENVRKAVADSDLSSESVGELTMANRSRQPVGSALSTDEGIGKGVSVARTWDDVQYQQIQGRHVAHHWNGLFGLDAEVSVHFGYRDMADSSQISSSRYSGYNVYDAVTGSWPRVQDVGCLLQSSDTAGWGGMPSMAVTNAGRVVTAATSHFGQGTRGDGSAHIDNMVFYQGSEFSCSWVPGVNTTFVDSLVYQPNFLNTSEGSYARNPQVATQWDGSNTIVHLLLVEDSDGVPLSGTAYSSGLDYITVTYFRKVGSDATSGSWGAGQIIDSIWSPWVAMAAAPHPGTGVAITYTNPSYYSAFMDNPYDLDVWLRESLDRGLSWEDSRNISAQDIGCFPPLPQEYAHWLESQPLYTNDGDLHVIFTGTPTSEDPYFDGFNWLSFNADIYHWSNEDWGGAGNMLDQVAGATFPEGGCFPPTSINTLHCGFGGYNAGYIANINISECDEKLYCIWNQIHERANRMPWMDAETQPAPGVLDDCAYEGNRLAIANWEILMSVAYLETSHLWDWPRNISDTYTPNCGLADDPEAEGRCASEYKPSVERYGMDESGLSLIWPAEATVDMSPSQDYSGMSFLHMQYLDDQFPGASSMPGSRRTEPRTFNSIKWIRLACVEPINEPQILVTPTDFSWPRWVELGVTTDLWVEITNYGNVALNVSEIGFDDNGGGWMSISEQPSAQDPLVVPAGQYGTVAFDIVVDASGLSTSTWLTGEVWLKSDAINEDSTAIHINLLAADHVEPVVWDTVLSDDAMFSLYYLPQGECVALAVSNNGEIGQGAGGTGTVNLDYVESELECGDRDSDAIYLKSGSAFAILADDADGTNAELTCSYMDENQADPNGWDPVLGPQGSIQGGLSGGGMYDSVYTGKFVNRDTTIAMERTLYAPLYEFYDGETINFVICLTKFYSADGAGHDHLTLGNVMDWDLPSEASAENSSGLSERGFVYMQGTDTTGVLSCQSHTRRYATEAFGGGYSSTEILADACANSLDNYSVNALTQAIMEDTTHYRDGTPLVPNQPNPEVWWQETAVSGGNVDPTFGNQAIWLTYVHDYNLSATDTLYYWTVLSTVRDGTLADLEHQVHAAEYLYLVGIRQCSYFSCCEGLVGDCNALGGDIPTIGDISVMIDAKFISGNCDIMPCLAECDVNQSGGCDPTCNDITIGDIALLIDNLFICTAPCTRPLPYCLDCQW